MFQLLFLLYRGAAPVVLPLASASDTARIHLPAKVREVKDLRRLGQADPRLLGVAESGVFEERSALRTPGTVADEIQTLVAGWTEADSQALPVRLEVLSFETWPVADPGPDPVRSRVKLRIVSLDPARPGVLLSPEASAETKGLHSPEDQTALLRGSLRDALGLLKPGMTPVPDTSRAVAPEPDSAADPRRLPTPPARLSSVHQALWLSAVPAFQTFAMALRYSQHASPQPGWTREYWGGFQVRGPWSDRRYRDTWIGEIQGGQAWWRRLDDGRSAWALVGSVGGILGTEEFRRASDTTRRDVRYFYAGASVRGGARVDEGSGWIGEAGIEADLRVPSVVAWFDPGVYAQVGWAF